MSVSALRKRPLSRCWYRLMLRVKRINLVVCKLGQDFTLLLLICFGKCVRMLSPQKPHW